MNDEPFWSGTDKVKRVAGHERQSGTIRIAEYFDSVRIDNADRIDDVPIFRTECLNGYLILLPDSGERTEICIAVARDTDIARLSGQSGPGYVSDTSAQSPIVDAFKQHDGHLESRNFQASQ